MSNQNNNYNNNYQPEPSLCNNKWCSNAGSIPTTGMTPNSGSNCSSLQSMITERNVTGGITGRGVTPCPYGFYQNDNKLLPSPATSNLSQLFFQPEQPGWLPQQSNPRSLIRIGNTYRNSR